MRPQATGLSRAPSAVARRRQFAVAAAAALCSIGVAAGAVPLHAQTALLVAPDAGFRSSVGQASIEEIEQAIGSVGWRRGPVGWADDRAAVEGTLADLLDAGARSVLILVLTVSDASGVVGPAAPVVAREEGVFVRTLPLGPPERSSPYAVTRAIERAAAYELARLVDAGDLAASGAALHQLAGINVTASREPVETFETPRPVSVVQRATIAQRAPNNASDLFTEIPGLDIEGVGTNQTRPMIRGLRGQRVLLLSEGLRLNNSRRRLDSGEPPAMAGLFELERVEIVRGATSVLYGSDAIGGVVNLIPRSAGPTTAGEWSTRGGFQYRYSSGDRQNRLSGTLSGGSGGFGFQLGGSWRNSKAFEAPAGTFGDLTLSDDTRVQDTGVEDYNLGARLTYDFGDRHSVMARFERYRASDAGFGFVEPEDLGSTAPRVQLLWPDLQFNRFIAGYEGRRLATAFADRVGFKAYHQSNEREFVTDVLVPVGPGISSVSENFTDIDTNGLRLEAAKLLAGRHTLTYGLDYYRDDSFNTDRRTRQVGQAPPTVDETPALPNARLSSIGIFAQNAFALGSRVDFTVGLRWQGVASETRSTEGLDEPLTEANNATLVGAANLLIRASDAVNLVASVGRGFRSPNLIERFFSGDAPGGEGRWVRNPGLGAETSLSTDLGVRAAGGRFYAEGFFFANFLTDGIQLRPTGEEVDGVSTFHNVNVSSIDITGVELTAGLEAVTGLIIEADYTHVSATNPDDPDDLVHEGYRDRINGRLRYSPLSDRLWGEFHVRHSGRTDEIVSGVSPIGDYIPAFTVMNLRGGVRLFGRNHLTIAIENLGNVLYAEPINVAFFRPSPRRQVVAMWTTEF